MFSDEPTVDLDKNVEIIALLAERWPRCFILAEDRRLPLKVGIFHDLKAALGGKVSPDQLSRTLGTLLQRSRLPAPSEGWCCAHRPGRPARWHCHAIRGNVGAGGQSRAAGQVPAQACTGSEAIVAGRLARG